MHVKAYIDGLRRYVVASFAGPRIVVADYDKCEMLSSIPLPEGIYNAFDMTADARLLVTGYWYTRGLDVWNVRTGERLFRFPLNRVSRVRFDRTGECIAVTSERGGRVIRWTTEQECRIKYCGDVDCAALRRSDNTLLLPSTRHGKAVRVDCNTLECAPVAFPIDAKIWTLKWSPDEARLVALASNGEVCCYHGVADEIVWQTLLDEGDRSSQLSFCGDGSLLALFSTESQRFMVLDSMTGMLLRVVNDRLDPESTFSGTSVMTSSGLLVDLATYALGEGCSNWRWWRRAGA